LFDNEIKKISVFPMCIKSVFESINSIRHNDISFGTEYETVRT